MQRIENTLGFATSLVAAAGLAMIVGIATPASGADIYVDTTNDLYNGNCIIQCSLRDAILISNANGEDDTIHVPAGNFSLTIPNGPFPSGTAGDLFIDSPDMVTIIGEGPGVTVIDGNAIDRVFRIDPGNGTVILKGLTITGGYLGVTAGSGGGIYNWDAILIIKGCEISHNLAFSPSALGGGIFNEEGVLWIDDSPIMLNLANGGGGGLYLGAGSTNQVTRSTLYGNGSMGGAGAVFTEGTSWFFNVTFHYNTGADDIDGIRNTGTATLRHCTLYEPTNPQLGISISCNTFFSEVILQNTVIFGRCDAFETNIDAQQGNIEHGDTCFLDYGNYANAGDSGVGLYGFGYNGGGVPTLKLYDTSWANDNQWTTTHLLTEDARFVARPVGTYGDSGAYELVPGEIFSHGFENGYTTGWGDEV